MLGCLYDKQGVLGHVIGQNRMLGESVRRVVQLIRIAIKKARVIEEQEWVVQIVGYRIECRKIALVWFAAFFIEHFALLHAVFALHVRVLVVLKLFQAAVVALLECWAEIQLFGLGNDFWEIGRFVAGEGIALKIDRTRRRVDLLKTEGVILTGGGLCGVILFEPHRVMILVVVVRNWVGVAMLL